MDFDAWIKAVRDALPGFTLAGLPTEFTMLGLAIGLGLFHLLIAARVGNSQRGIQWNVGPRDQPSPPVSALAGRLERAYKNFMETFPFFAAAILATHAMNRFSWLTLVGSQVYLIARMVYLPLYAAGVPVFRTLTWLVSLIGLIFVVAALFIPGA
jgi:uncharacterized MAPEG superfamily protein